MAKVASMMAMAVLALTGSVTTSYAQNAPVKPRVQPAPDAFTVRGDFNPTDYQFGLQSGGRALVWDARKGRWGLTLDITPRAGRETRIQDVEAGAFFKVTPQLRVGGAVGVGPSAPIPVRKPGEREEAPRVRLETAFKF